MGKNGPKWTKMDPSGLKCYVDVTQLERGNNKCYTLVFRYYINRSC